MHPAVEMAQLMGAVHGVIRQLWQLWQLLGTTAAGLLAPVRQGSHSMIQTIFIHRARK